MKTLLLLTFMFFVSVGYCEDQSVQEQLGVIKANEYVQLTMSDGKKVLLFKARMHRAKIIGNPVSYDKAKKKYVVAEGNSPEYYARRIKKIEALDIKKKPGK
jgi:hypothetical protein